MKAEFERQLNQLLGVQKERKQLITDDRYNELLAETKEAIARRRNGVRLSGIHYRRLKRFDVTTIGDDSERLVQRNEKGQSSRKLYFCMVSEMFDVMHKAHLDTGHKKEKGMELKLKRTFCNITREVIAIYLNLCPDCGTRRKYQSKTHETEAKAVQEGTQPPPSRCQVDIIDMQREPDGEYKYILIHQDHNTKFLILRALKTRTPEEVADVLYDIFCLVGIPSTMCCNIQRECCNEIHRILSSNWNVKPERIELPAFSTNQASKHIHKSLREWMSDNQIRNWASNLRIIQSLRNHSFHPDVQRTPHEAMFGNSENNPVNDNDKGVTVRVSSGNEEKLRKQLELLKQKLAELNEIRRTLEKNRKTNQKKDDHNVDRDKLRCKTTPHNGKRQLVDRTDDVAPAKRPIFKVGDMVMVRMSEMN